jgi:hypothetical protein
MTGPAFDEGARLFDEAIRWIAKGQEGVPEVNDFYAHTALRLDLPESRIDGDMKIWFQRPDLYRQELAPAGQAATKKILAGELAWVIDASGTARARHGRPDGEADIEQMKEDRDRYSDLTRFLTLKGLKGPGIAFEWLGPSEGKGAYAGSWQKVARHAPGRGRIIFYFAYTKDGSGVAHATFPGVVRVEGDPVQGFPTEDYILKEWDPPAPAPMPGQPAPPPRTIRYPTKIEGISIEPAKPPARFLFLVVRDLKVNAGIDPARFRP